MKLIVFMITGTIGDKVDINEEIINRLNDNQKPLLFQAICKYSGGYSERLDPNSDGIELWCVTRYWINSEGLSIYENNFYRLYLDIIDDSTRLTSPQSADPAA